MQVRKFHEEKGIKPTTKQTNVKDKIASLEPQLGIGCHKERGRDS